MMEQQAQVVGDVRWSENKCARDRGEERPVPCPRAATIRGQKEIAGLTAALRLTFFVVGLIQTPAVNQNRRKRST